MRYQYPKEYRNSKRKIPKAQEIIKGPEYLGRNKEKNSEMLRNIGLPICH